MALPADGLLFEPPTQGVFLPPRDIVKMPHEDWSTGGIALNDNGAGLEVYHWRYVYDPDSRAISVGVPGVVPDVVVHTLSVDAIEISGSFDIAMQPIVAWQAADDTSWFRWFDPTVPGFESIQLPSGSYDVRVVLDDTRSGQGEVLDALVTYLRAGSVYQRQLRDRFSTEYEIATGAVAGGRLSRCGMAVFGAAHRMQWEFSYLQATVLGFEDSRFPVPFIYPKFDLKEKVFGRKSWASPVAPAGAPLPIPKSRTRP